EDAMGRAPVRAPYLVTAAMVGAASIAAAIVAVTGVARSGEPSPPVPAHVARAADSVAASRAATVEIRVDRSSYSIAQTSRLGGIRFHLVRSASSEGECLDVFAFSTNDGDDAGHVGGCGARKTDSVTEGWNVGGLLIDDRTVHIAFGYAEPSATTVTLTRADGSTVPASLANGTWLLVEEAGSQPPDDETQTEMPYVSIESRNRSGEVLGSTSLG
ncbi:MAG TPA: hypothetical protein VNP94_13205, partial [Actinomycetota bacterium]|nr:hypothetical protein [Actinomycetota bacterium]